MKCSASVTRALAVAVLAVAGVVGTVWAQGHVGGLNPAAEDVVNTVPKMKASFHIDNMAYIEGESKDPKDAQLRFNVDTLINNVNPGNLGVIRIRTNATSWDVEMMTKNGGRLVKEGSGTGIFDSVCVDPVPFPGSGCKPGGWNYTERTNPGQALLFFDHAASFPSPGRIDGGTRDTVLLEVAIGMAESAGGDTAVGAGFGTIFTKGATAAGYSFAPTVIDSQTIVNSNDAATPISFAKMFAKDYPIGSGSNANSAAHATIGGVDLTVSDAAFGSTKGFGPTAVNATTGSKWEYFYINVGIHPDNFSKIVAAKSGDYNEEFTFELVTNLE